MTFFPDISTFVKIGTLEIKWYAVLILTGAFIVYYIMSKEIKKMGYEQDDADNVFIGALLCGVIGARLWYVLFSDLPSYLADPITIFEMWNGGLAIHGGIIAGVAFSYFYAKKHKMNFMRLSDSVLPYVLIAQAIGRWGNFLNKEAFGQPVTEAYFASWPSFLNFIKEGMFINGSYQEPMFFYESCLCLIGIVLIMIYKRFSHPKRGDLSYCYTLWYGAIRFWIEAKRSDSLMFMGIKTAQIVSICFILFGLLGLFGVFTKLKKQKIKPVLIFDNDGTISDTEKIIKLSFISTFEKYKPEYKLSEEELDSFLGPTLEDSFGKYFAQDKVGEVVEYYRINNSTRLKEISPMPHAKELVDKWKKEGYRLAIVSAKTKETVVEGLKVTGMVDDFEVIVGPQDMKKPKPAKDGIIEACKKLGVSHDDVIYVGDSVVDVQAGRNAGVYSVGYSAKENRQKELKAALPNRLISDLSEIDDVLKADISWSYNLR